MRLRRVLKVTVATTVTATASVLALAGCGGNTIAPEALDKSGTASAESTLSAGEKRPPSASPSATAPTPGETRITTGSGKVDEQTKAEVKEFVSAYLIAQNKATANGDFKAVDAMIDDCQVCAASKRYISRAYRSGGGVSGGIFTDPQITVGGIRDGRILVSVKAVISAYKTTNGSGKVVDQGPAEQQNYQYHVSEAGGSWRIVGGSVVG